MLDQFLYFFEAILRRSIEAHLELSSIGLRKPEISLSYFLSILDIYAFLADYVVFELLCTSLMNCFCLAIPLYINSDLHNSPTI